MNAKQQQTWNEFVRRMLNKQSLSGRRQSEVKEAWISSDPYVNGARFCVLEVGDVGDEGTALAWIGRDHRCVVIGRSGGIKLLTRGRPKIGMHNAVWHFEKN